MDGESKSGNGSILPESAVATSWEDCSPLVNHEDVKRLHLFGIPLVSAIRDPFTNKPQVMTPDDITRFIEEAVSLVELEGGFEIFPRQHKERQPYDLPAQNSFGFTVLRQRPVQSIQRLAVTSSDGVNIWDVPLAWIETGYIHQGQINLVPFAVAAQSGVTIPITSGGGMGLLPSLFKFSWVPSLWVVEYTTGFCDGCIPKTVNQLIGVVAAMEILSALAATFSRNTGSSLGIDGLSQSVSTPGPQLYDNRLMALGEKRKWLVSKLKRSFGLGFFSDNV
jgi:hypothetical protein